MATNDPQEALRDGDLDACRAALIEQVKAEPGDVKLRAFLSQIFMVQGEWDRASKQLDMLGSLEEASLDLVTDYRTAIEAEAARAKVMDGTKPPSIMGEPSSWVAKLVEALRLDGANAASEAYELRQEAFAEAPASPGEADGKRFQWLSDADQRFGPVLEAVMNGEYHWIPFDAIATLDFEPPKDLRDVVWTVGIMTLVNGGQWPILVPTRYPRSDTVSGGEAGHALSRRTDWDVLHEDHYAGIGQRMLTTDEDDLALLEIRNITFDHAPDMTEETPDPAPADGD